MWQYLQPESLTSGQDYYFCIQFKTRNSFPFCHCSDGYCNSRIVIVSPEGKVIGSIANGDLSVAHSLSLLERDDLICVADREGRRVACYTAGLNGSQAGKLIIDLRNQIGRVYAIEHLGDILFAVNGPNDDDASRPNVVAIDMPTERLIARYEPETGFFEPHDMALTADGQSFFVADLDARTGTKVHKFDLTA
jgi:peptidylamidoglycolate lyase